MQAIEAEIGRIEYRVRNCNGPALLLSLVTEEDLSVLREKGVREVRLQRIVRLTHEAEEQGQLLTYEDLSVLLVTSTSTLKRDIVHLESRGIRVPLKGRRLRRGA